MLEKNFTGVWIGLVAAMIVVCSYIRVPLYPIPFTLQAYIIMLAPMVFGARIAFFGVALYILLGIAGLPVFSSGGGMAYILRPSFGYLVGFLISTIPAGLIAKRFNNVKGYAAAGITSILIYDTLGSLGLYLNINFIQGKEMELITAFKTGFIAFLLPDAIKCFGAVVTVPILKKALKHRMFISNIVKI